MKDEPDVAIEGDDLLVPRFTCCMMRPMAVAKSPDHALGTAEVARVLAAVRALSADAAPEECWDAFAPADRPTLFRLLDLGADLPRFAQQRALAEWPVGVWPELDAVANDLSRLQALVDRPAVPAQAESATVYAADDSAARDELEARHCVTVEGLLATAEQGALDAEIERQSGSRAGFWGALGQDEAPELHRIFADAVASEPFRSLTGYDPSRDTFSLTLSLQDLQADGIGWHRDLYWPKEWVGEDVFAVLYGLGDDTPELGGAFVYYVPWRGEGGEILAVYRRRHQATILWNSADPAGRILHAVSRYHTAVTARHLVILQCLRSRK